ncbi:MAG: class I SAM-dependent methyltransferase [SAR324 cluster bacterium]|nr:class I SAM-dependent methyltransferase [SAR324 cluster bacterium]
METWIAEQYIGGRIPIPASLLQSALQLYMHWYHRLDPWYRPEAQAASAPRPSIAARSRELIDAQYDRPRQLFENFLGTTMKYSMGYWETGAGTLEQAQAAMLDDLCEKAQIRDGQEILDVGCGFGSFAAHVLHKYPSCSVAGLNLSKVQADYILEKQREPGHPLNTDRFQLIRDDFNTVTLERRFDRVISIGFFEHVSDVGLALEKIAGLLKPGGKCLLHYIVFRKQFRIDVMRPTRDGFISKYIFPGGTIWREDELFKHQHHLRVADAWFLNGRNYRRTLESWLENFWRNMARIRAECGEDQRLIKVWDLYLRSSIAVFRTNRGNFYGNGQYLLTPA